MILTPSKAATLAYKPKQTAMEAVKADGYSMFQPFECRRTDTQGFVCTNGTMAYVSFRGTESFRDLLSDIKFRKVKYPNGGMVHRGFYEAARSVLNPINRVILSLPTPRRIIFTGHSLGAALALICADLLPLNPGAVYLFGCPRVFGKDAALGYNERLGSKTIRYVNNNDIIPMIPPALLGYRHVGHEIYIDHRGIERRWIGWRSKVIDRIVGRVKSPILDGILDHSAADAYGNVAGLAENER
jgi:triacylglycerol lipase